MVVENYFPFRKAYSNSTLNRKFLQWAYTYYWVCGFSSTIRNNGCFVFTVDVAIDEVETCCHHGAACCCVVAESTSACEEFANLAICQRHADPLQCNDPLKGTYLRKAFESGLTEARPGRLLRQQSQTWCVHIRPATWGKASLRFNEPKAFMRWRIMSVNDSSFIKRGLIQHNVCHPCSCDSNKSRKFDYGPVNAPDFAGIPLTKHIPRSDFISMAPAHAWPTCDNRSQNHHQCQCMCNARGSKLDLYTADTYQGQTKDEPVAIVSYPNFSYHLYTFIIIIISCRKRIGNGSKRHVGTMRKNTSTSWFQWPFYPLYFWGHFFTIPKKSQDSPNFPQISPRRYEVTVTPQLFRRVASPTLKSPSNRLRLARPGWIQGAQQHPSPTPWGCKPPKKSPRWP